MASRNLSAKHPLKNIAMAPPVRKTTLPGGLVVTEKLCPIPFNRKFIGPDGSSCVVPLANGFTIRGFKNNDYGVQMMEQLLKAGFLPFDECPIATRRVPPLAGDKPCDGKFSNEECCPHLTAIALARQADHREKQQAYGRSFETEQQKILDLLFKQAQLAAQAADPKATGKRGLPSG